MVYDITTIDIGRGMEALPNRLSNATKNRYKAAISVVFSYACRVYGLHINPVRIIPVFNPLKPLYIRVSEKFILTFELKSGIMHPFRNIKNNPFIK